MSVASDGCYVDFTLQRPLERGSVESGQRLVFLRIDAEGPQQPARARYVRLTYSKESDFLTAQKIADDFADCLERVGLTDALTKPFPRSVESRIVLGFQPM